MSHTQATHTHGPLIEGENPFALFAAWFADAQAKEVNDPNGAAVATVDASGMPNVRMVLIKSADETGFVFYTNLESQKGRELTANPRAALLYHWKSLRRQVRVQGPVERVSDAEADAYFATRPRDSQIGAWASAQSRPMEGRFVFEREIAKYAAKFGFGKIPRPPHWSGFRLVPQHFEFWSDRPFRLHDRLVFMRSDLKENAWRTERLFP